MKIITKRIKRLIKLEITKTIILVILTVGLFSGGIFFLWASSLAIPDFESFEARVVSQSTKIYDRTGKVLLWSIGDSLQRTVVGSSLISSNIKNATVAIEDSEFYTHNGVRPLAIIRAVIENVKAGGKVQGGSTITQQVVKNSVLTGKKSWGRKLTEAVLAYRLEKVMTKDEILEVYLNEIPYGGIIYGVEEASLTFFGKNSSEVSMAEAAYLAAIPKAPTFYSPYGNNVTKLKERKNIVLNRMAELGFITDEERDEAKREEIIFIPKKDRNIKAPHFVMYVKEYLESKYGADMVENGGLKVITTLDWDMQRKAEEIITEYAKINEDKYGVGNSGMVALDPKTGQILAMVGSRDYFDTKNEGNFNVTIANRQPGSSFKPFVYATAFNKGYTPETVIFDVSTEFFTGCDKDSVPKPGFQESDCYRPRNYTGLTYGPLTLRSALQGSINIVAVKLLYLAGISDSIQTARAMGITTLTDPDRYGLTLVLGGGEVKLLEMTSAYSVFATDGIRNPHTPILSIQEINGEPLEKFEEKRTRALPEQTARLISDVLSDNEARSFIFGANSSLDIPGYKVASKTGTTNDAKDAWIVGYTPNIAVGVWVGNNDNKPIGQSSSGVAAPIWNAFMKEVLPLYSNESFRSPDPTPSDLKPILRGIWQGGQTYIIDTISGKLATELTPESTRKEVAILGAHNILHWVTKNNPRGPIPNNPESDPQYQSWEYAVQLWLGNEPVNTGGTGLIPTDFDDVHTTENKPTVTIISPPTNSQVGFEELVIVNTSVFLKQSFSKIDYFINGSLIGTSFSQNSSFQFVPSDFIEESAKAFKLKAVVYDSFKNNGYAEVDLNVI